MAPEDMLRELEKIHDALRWAVSHQLLDSESKAALHCNEKTYHTPLTTRLIAAQAATRTLRNAIEEGAD
jgi:hypothetical protein